MELIGEIVKHKAFGRGKVTEFVNNNVTVVFEESKEEKRFLYPSAFGEFLQLENNYLSKHIEEDKNVIAQKEAERKSLNEERFKLELTIKSKDVGKKSPKKAATKTSDKSKKKSEKKKIDEEEISEDL